MNWGWGGLGAILDRFFGCLRISSALAHLRIHGAFPSAILWSWRFFGCLTQLWCLGAFLDSWRVSGDWGYSESFAQLWCFCAFLEPWRNFGALTQH